MFRLVFLLFFSFMSIVFASGGYDHGTSAGKGNFDFSLTLNPFNYFQYGQSNVVIGYGLTDRLDINGYYSIWKNNNKNYYCGFSYQLYQSKNLDLSTGFGVRKKINVNKIDLFMPQLLYTLRFTKKVAIGGSFVNIRNQDLTHNMGTAIDAFLMYKVFNNKKFEINFTFGAFNPVMWEPNIGDWYPTYSVDIKIKK